MNWVRDWINRFNLQKIHFLKELLKAGDLDGSGDCLVMEWGEQFCHYGMLDTSNRVFGYFRYLSFDEGEEAWKDVAESLPTPPAKTILGLATPQTLLVPDELVQTEGWLPRIYEVNSFTSFQDKVENGKMLLSYGCREADQQVLQRKFPSAIWRHVHTAMLSTYNGISSGDQISLHFNLRTFRVLVKKNDQVQLIQMYAYQTPLDVVYYLLKICFEIQLDQKNVFLIISGLIEKDSALYKQLHQYFFRLHFADAQAYSLPESDYPAYYFSSLINLASCAL